MLGGSQGVRGRVEFTRALPVQHEGLFTIQPVDSGKAVTDMQQLNSIDNMRVDGKFYVGTDIPEGQGSVNALLAECYDLAWELRAAVTDEDENERNS